MAITQLSAFLENRPGTLYDAVSSISDAGVNIRALSVADTRDFGILRLIVSDVEKTKEVLSDNVVITQTKVSDECYAAVKEAVEAHSPFETVYETTAGCTISCHCGPGTLGVLFVRN